jgi:hypothetical protein
MNWVGMHCVEKDDEWLGSMTGPHTKEVWTGKYAQLCSKALISFGRTLIRLKRIYNFLCSMLVLTPFALCFVTLHGIFMHFPELTY